MPDLTAEQIEKLQTIDSGVSTCTSILLYAIRKMSSDELKEDWPEWLHGHANTGSLTETIQLLNHQSALLTDKLRE